MKAPEWGAAQARPGCCAWGWVAHAGLGMLAEALATAVPPADRLLPPIQSVQIVTLDISTLTPKRIQNADEVGPSAAR